jgi:hypothetical protein
MYGVQASTRFQGFDGLFQTSGASDFFRNLSIPFLQVRYGLFGKGVAESSPLGDQGHNDGQDANGIDG